MCDIFLKFRSKYRLAVIISHKIFWYFTWKFVTRKNEIRWITFAQYCTYAWEYWITHIFQIYHFFCLIIIISVFFTWIRRHPLKMSVRNKILSQKTRWRKQCQKSVSFCKHYRMFYTMITWFNIPRVSPCKSENVSIALPRDKRVTASLLVLNLVILGHIKGRLMYLYKIYIVTISHWIIKYCCFHYVYQLLIDSWLFANLISDSPLSEMVMRLYKAFETHFPETLDEGKSISTKADSGHHKDHAEVEIKVIIAIYRAERHFVCACSAEGVLICKTAGMRQLHVYVSITYSKCKTQTKLWRSSREILLG